MSGDDLGACIESVVDVMGNYIRKPLIIPRGDTRPDFDMVVVQPQQIVAVAKIQKGAEALVLGAYAGQKVHDGAFPGEFVERCVEFVIVNNEGPAEFLGGQILFQKFALALQ